MEHPSGERPAVERGFCGAAGVCRTEAGCARKPLPWKGLLLSGLFAWVAVVSLSFVLLVRHGVGLYLLVLKPSSSYSS